MSNQQKIEIDSPNRILWFKPGTNEPALAGWCADVLESPLTGKTMVRIVDFISEISDPDAGKWVYACDCKPAIEDDGIHTVGC